MKKYIKILIISSGIQLGCLAMGMLLANIPESQGSLKMLGVAVFLMGFLISIIVDIVLAIKWGANITKKLVYIFLMPTNYTWLICILFAFWHIGQWIEILTNMSPNFG